MAGRRTPQQVAVPWQVSRPIGQELVAIVPNATPRQQRIIEALAGDDASLRMQAALAVGTDPDPVFLEPLMTVCAHDPDFNVRDTTSWALTRLPAEVVLPRVRRELYSTDPQPLSQAIHTLSKIAEPSTWPWITTDMLRDADDRVARTAWRTAVTLVPVDEEAALAEELASQLGRGDLDVQLALTRSLVNLGDASIPPVDRAAESSDTRVATHARATVFFRHDPGIGFDAAVERARLTLARGRSMPWRPDDGA